jgi:hypothetical protein
MSDLSPDRAAESLRSHLDAARAARAAAAAHPVASAQRSALREWQAARLRRTHADLLASPRYARAAEFFLADLYSVADTSERDRELDRALPKMVRLLPESAIETLALALEADALAEQLDAAVAERLFANGRTTAITDVAYATAYRAAGDRPARERQIAIVDAIGRRLERIAHAPMLGQAVKLMRRPARAAGFGELQAFLERGLVAFRSMDGAAEFLDLVQQRETALMDALFAGRSPPRDAPAVPDAPGGGRRPTTGRSG